MYGVIGATDLIIFGHPVQVDWVFIVNRGRMVRIVMKNQVIVIEERNRIANEIHDSVSQRLFGIVCSLHSLQAKSSRMTTEELNEELQFLSQSASTTLQELRAAIYRLSSAKNGDESLFVRLQTYLDEYARLYAIQIDCQLMGNDTSISNELKQALYQIICEACGNAVRHGRCSIIEIKLSLLDEKTVLEIQDNGIGIKLPVDESHLENGFGLSNMKRLTHHFAGTFLISGVPGSGTKIHIDIPTTKILKKEQVNG